MVSPPPHSGALLLAPVDRCWNLRNLMPMRRLTVILMFPALAAALGACGLGQGLSTGSVLGGSQANAGAGSVPPPVTPIDRVTQVAATSARAERCGFNFNPDRLRASYLASETATPGAPADLTQRYDVTRKAVIGALVSDEGYCTEGRTKAIKADLARHLAGDYAPTQKRQDVANDGWFSPQTPAYRQRETVNPEILNDPTAKKTKRIDY